MFVFFGGRIMATREGQSARVKVISLSQGNQINYEKSMKK